MSITPKYYIVDAKALPEVFLKVAEAKRMLETGEASTVGEATRQAEVSRSAFYKYKDMVMPFNNTPGFVPVLSRSDVKFICFTDEV